MAPIVSRIMFAMSALVVVLAIACAWLYFTDDSNTLPIDRVLSAEQIANLPENAQGPLVVQLGHNHFALVNPTRFPVQYAGYRMDSIAPRPRPGEINPLYDKQFRDPAGAWQSNVGGWCGTGSALLTVRPGHAGTFNVHSGVDLPPERKGPVERVGVTCSTGNPANAQAVWSAPFVP
jgi:hypothetical protein